MAFRSRTPSSAALALIRARALPQARIAALAGVSKATVSRALAGVVPMPDKVIDAIATAHGSELADSVRRLAAGARRGHPEESADAVA